MGMFDEQSLPVPTISWVGARRGLEITGTILPLLQRGKAEPTPYRETPDTDRDGNPRTFPSGDPILRGEFLIQTALSGWDRTSSEFEARTADFPDETDTGLRRWIVGSKYATQAVKAAYKKLRTKPEIGGTLTIKVTGIQQGTASNGEKYTTPDLDVSWSPATPEGRKVADDYAEKNLKREEEFASSGAFGEQDAAPPF